MSIDRTLYSALFLSLTALAAMAGTAPAHAQSVMQDCIQQGFKPGTAGFYHCLQESTGAENPDSQNSGAGDPASILSGDPDNAVTDFSGSTMDGATSPDPNILKQLNTGKPSGK
jgi:hypothetical protein